MAVYDYNGNQIDSFPADSSKLVKDAFLEAVANNEINLGAQVGATLSYTGLSNDWISNAQSAYAAMLTKYKTCANYAVPFFISTDQHGRGVEQHRWANNIDKDGVNFANINLGDTVTDYFNFTQLQNAAGRTKQVKNYISITGNHDALWSTNTGADVPSVYDLTRFFGSTYNREVIPKTNSSYSVLDGQHSVRYVVVDSYFNVGKTAGSLGNSQLSGELADWLITELGKDDFDIVYLQHWLLADSPSTYKMRDGTADPYNTGGSIELRNLVTARRNKTSGSVTDKDGVSHSYDFTGCTHDLLCALCGHEHLEVYATLDNLLCYVSDWYGNNGSCVFGFADRFERKLHIWKFTSTAVSEELILSF